MRRWIAAAFVLASLLVAPRASAAPEDFMLNVAVRAESVHPFVGDQRVTYQGPLASGAPGALDAPARALGVDRPTLTALSFVGGARVFRYATLHVVLELGWGHGDGASGAQELTWQPPQLTMFGAAFEPGAALPAGPFVFGVSSKIGWRSLLVALPGFAPVPCRGGSCTATTTIAEGALFEPRLTAEYGEQEGHVRVFVGVEASALVTPMLGYTFGATLGVHVGDPPRELTGSALRR